MDNSYYISSYCLLRNNKLIVNDQEILGSEPNDLPNIFFKQIYNHLQIEYPKFHKMDLLCKGVFLATEFLTKEHPIQEENVALVFSNYSSSHVADKKHADNIFAEDPTASPAVFVYTLPNIIMGELSIRHKLYSENIFYIFDRFDPDFLIQYNTQILDQGKADKVLSGWVEVQEESYDIFLYLVDKEGEYLHTNETITKLYTQGLCH